MNDNIKYIILEKHNILNGIKYEIDDDVCDKNLLW